ncbi:MAG: helix-turn-helix transcriptional regulator [Alphaproteobacteria bacterium]|nr:helix-turn-helix transcriptional regulator [Alphaproteobacteria bacterium]
MKSYGQFCPVAKAAEVFCERWTALIIRDLASGGRRFSALQRGVPLMSPTLLSRRLKTLEAEGILTRKRGESGGHWVYHLTPAGEEFAPLVMALGTWGQRWSRRELEEGEIDLGLFIYAMENTVDPSAFGERRTVVRLELTDQPKAKRLWWFLNEDGRAELCVEPPGPEIDLYIAASLPDMIRIWRGDESYARMLDEGRLEVLGPARLRRATRRWLNASVLAHVKPAQARANAAT